MYQNVFKLCIFCLFHFLVECFLKFNTKLKFSKVGMCVPFLGDLKYTGARRGWVVLIIQSLLQMTKSLNSNLDGTFEHWNTISYQNSGVCIVLIDTFYLSPMNLRKWIISSERDSAWGPGEGHSIQPGSCIWRKEFKSGQGEKKGERCPRQIGEKKLKPAGVVQ